MTLYKSDKLFFDNVKKSFSVNRRTEALFRQFVLPTTSTKFKIELLEISVVDNPSDITIEVLLNYSKKRQIKLYQFRTDFIFQNNIFILGTKDYPQFQIDFPKPSEPEFDFTINIISESDFKMSLYYSTDQGEEKDFRFEFI